MNNRNIYVPAALTALLISAASCEENVMEWKAPDSTVKPTELPMELAEKIAQYGFIKDYMKEYHPNTPVTIGMGLANFLGDEQYQQTVKDNFQGVTFGNAMKHQSIVQSNGSYKWDSVDEFLAMNTGMPIHGHNLLWHTQQQQSYLKSLIAPEMKVSGGASGGIVNVITNSDFEDGTLSGWDGWSHYAKSVDSPGHDSQYCLKAEMDAETSANWDCQLWWPTELKVGVTYAYRFWVKSPDNIKVQFVGQNAEYGGIYKTEFDAGKDWTLCEGEFEYTDSDAANVIRIGIQFGGTPVSTLYVDDFEFGEKAPDGPLNMCANGDFSSGTDNWTLNNPGDGITAVEISDAPSGNKHVMQMKASASSANAWDLQMASADMVAEHGKKVQVSFFVKSDQPGRGRISYNGLTNNYPWTNWTGKQDSWTEFFETNSSWTQISYIIQNFSSDFADGASVWNMNFDFGYDPGVTYYIDNVVVNVVEEEPAAKPHRAVSISYEPKSAEEKKAALLGAMEDWIKEAMTHMGDNCTSWDVINEPIGDDGTFRGIDGGWMSGDAVPVENTESGLTLNWANESRNGHFYWGYYIGMDYAVKAFQYARQYMKNDAKLYVNDYNLETSDRKRAKLIEFVKYIDDNGGKVDGIGTQMHVQKSITKEQVDKMFKELAATGKLIRITELDVALGTEAKTLADYELQGEVYHMILTSYFENVPEPQQGGITIWSLTDAPEEHEYWLNGDEPNLFDASYGRKIAYKRVCDAIAGRDLGEDFTSPDYSQAAGQ